MLAAQMCLTTVDVRYDGLLRPGFGYIMARKVPGYWQLQKLLFSYSGRENFLLCTAAFILLLQSGNLEPKRITYFHLFFFPLLFSGCIFLFICLSFRGM